MYCDGATHCCAVNEFEGLNDPKFTPEGAIKTMIRSMFDEYNEPMDDGTARPCYAHIVMFQKYGSGTSVEQGCENLDNLSKFITANKLGTIVHGITKKNPNSGNMVKPAIFTPSLSGFKAYASKHGINIDALDTEDREYW